ncbi:MAG: hypothetical protein JWR07_2280 [Nevskia sp.]|nr:hypothetical protein [Nevskia sp.]
MHLVSNTESPSLAADAWSLLRVRELDEQGKFEAAVAALWHLARKGDADAMTLLAKRLLIGQNAPHDPGEAIGMLAAAADRNHGEAAAQMATLAAAGAWMPQEWSAALDFLVQGAQAGSLRAQDQLLLLADETSGSRNTEVVRQSINWRALREEINLQAWINPALARQPLCESPRIRLAQSFASLQICRWLIGLARGKVRPAMMYNGKGSHFTAERTNSDYFFDIVGSDVIVAATRQRISSLLKMPTFAMEPPQILHYAIGQQLKAHYDHIGGGNGYEGERIATFLLYLNDDYEGGELDFPKVELRLKARAGNGVYFSNVDHAGLPDKLTLHCGLEVTKGEKWVFSQWIHDRTFTGSM